MGPAIHIVREVSNMLFASSKLAKEFVREVNKVNNRPSRNPTIDWDARIFTGLDIWNDPNRWDNVDDSHKVMFWD